MLRFRQNAIPTLEAEINVRMLYDVYLLYEHGWLPFGSRGRACGLCWRVDHAFVPTKLSCRH
jgi:hypothetical protein